MICIILAAGKGSRLLPLTSTIPKSLVDINNKSLIDRLLEIVYTKFELVIIVVDYLDYKIINHVKSSKFSKNIVFVKQNKSVSGTFGALISAKNYINSSFIVICSDNLYCESDIEKLIQNKNSFLVKKVSLLERQKMYRDAKKALIQDIDQGIILDAGAWSLEKNFIDLDPVFVPGTGELSIPHTLFRHQKLTGQPYKIIHADFWFPVGTFWELDFIRTFLS